MNMNNLLTRRSCRSFLEKPIPREQLDDILKAALYAPSGRNCQSWQFTALTSRKEIGKLASLVGQQISRPGFDFFQPEVIIIGSNQEDNPLGKEDNACALQNIFLAAHSYGIASVWINQMQGISNAPAIRQKLTEYDIPEDHVVYGVAALGYPSEDLPADPRKFGVIKIVE